MMDNLIVSSFLFVEKTISGVTYLDFELYFHSQINDIKDQKLNEIFPGYWI